MGTSSRKRAIALATSIALLGWAATGAAEPGASEIQEAIRRLDGEHDESLAAVRRLQIAGAPAAAGIRDAWPSLSARAQRRAIDALLPLARTEQPAVEALVEAARSDEEELREKALRALRQSGPKGRDGLLVLLGDPKVGDRAAMLLARDAPGFAMRPLLHAIGDDGGADRPGLRNALTVAVQRADAPGRPIGAWLDTKPSSEAVASASLALASLESERKTLGPMLEYALRDASEFETRWRLLQCAPAAGPSEQIDSWVRSQVEGPPEWMLRQAAVDAIAARGRRELARASLGDPYPRVRQHAAVALSGDAESLLERAALARRDSWPMVRAAAVTSLRREGDALPILVAAVDDSMSAVRVAAVDALSASSHDEGWERIHRRLRDRNEWPSVTAAAIEYAVAHCRTDAAESLFLVVMRAASSNALTEDLNNAARAIEALRILDTPEARSVVERLRSAPEVPPTLKMALEQPLGGDRRCPPESR